MQGQANPIAYLRAAPSQIADPMGTTRCVVHVLQLRKRSHAHQRALHCLADFRTSREEMRAHWFRPYFMTAALRISSCTQQGEYHPEPKLDMGPCRTDQMSSQGMHRLCCTPECREPALVQLAFPSDFQLLYCSHCRLLCPRMLQVQPMQPMHACTHACPYELGACESRILASVFFQMPPLIWILMVARCCFQKGPCC